MPRPRSAGSPAQQAYLRRLYQLLNRRCFERALPDDLPLRLSVRMTKRLGSVRFGHGRRGRYVVHELALNLALFSPINWDVLAEAILHEMAHVAAILHDGETGHGPAWRRWARSVGCGCGRVCGLLFVPLDADTVAHVPPLPTIRRRRPRRELA